MSQKLPPGATAVDASTCSGARKTADASFSVTDDASSEILLTEKQLAARWNISIKTLQKWRLSGTGPPFCKFNRAVRYSLRIVRAFEQQRQYASTTEASDERRKQ